MTAPAVRSLPATFDRAALFAALLLVAALNALSGRFWLALDLGLFNGAGALLNVSAIIWFALFALTRIGFSAEATEPLRRGDGWIAALLLIASLIPLILAAALGLLGAGLYLSLTSPPGASARRLGLIALALTGPTLWGPAALALIGPEISHLEALFVGGLSTLATDDNVMIANDGTQFIISGACSSVANISLAVVLLVALSQLLKIRLTSRLIPWTILAIGLIILFNTVRLASIGYLPGQFEFLHLGAGQALFATAGLIAMSAAIMTGLYRAARAEA